MIHGAHDSSLVALSVLIATAASYTALDLAGRIRECQGWVCAAWLVTAAVVMGGGIWSMHFVAMLAFSLPGMEVSYDIHLTLISLVVPIVVTGVAFQVVNSKGTGPLALALSGLFMGIGVVAMHYIGMAAMRMPADLSYHRVWVSISVLIAIGASTIALWLFFRRTGAVVKLIASVAMGFAISGMHYAAMQGTMFADHGGLGSTQSHSSLGQTALALGVAAATFFILFLALVAAMFDRRFALLAARGADAIRQSEERLRLMLQSVTDYAIFMLDADGRIASWNAGAERIKGYQADEIVGSSLSIFYTEEDIQTGLPARALETAAREGKFEIEGWRIRKDGSRFWASVVIDPVRDESGHLIGFVKVTRDITERKETQEALNKAQEALFQAQKMDAVGQLTGGVAHDFNNLLTIILGNLDLAQRNLKTMHEGAESRIARALENAIGGARRATTLTGHLLAFSRRQPLEPRVLDVNRFLSHLANFLKTSVGEQVQLEAVGAGGLWQVEADPVQLETSLLNLAVNARDAMMPKGGKLTVEASNVFLDEDYCRVHKEVKAGQYVQIAVTDTGAGMPREVIDRAFEPFFTTKEAGQGTGLGLSQVFGFVKQSGGHLKIYSEPGQGTTVKIYLPRAYGKTENVEEELRSSPAQGSETILLVEDDPDVRTFVSEVLRELKYKVLEASDAVTAMHYVNHGDDFDLLLTDVILPGENGRQLAQKVQTARPEVKVLFMTGYSRNAIVHQGRLDPGVALIQKPLTQQALAEKIRSVLDGL